MPANVNFGWVGVVKVPPFPHSGAQLEIECAETVAYVGVSAQSIPVVVRTGRKRSPLPTQPRLRAGHHASALME